MSKIPDSGAEPYQLRDTPCEDGEHQFFVFGNGIDVRCVVCGWHGKIIDDAEAAEIRKAARPVHGYGYNWRCYWH